MLRHALTIWFILATVLVPKVCCCAFSPPITETKSPSAHTAKVSNATCPFCRTSETTPDDENTRSPERPKCPCKEGHSHETPAVVTAPITQTIDAPSGQITPYLLDTPSVRVVATAVPFASLPRTGPTLTADDLLRVFHILRC